jgi:acylphosphatase
VKTFRILIYGNVQGVNYRASAKQQAIQLRLTGTVRNLESGEVEAIVSGDPERLQEFIEWAKKGPLMADVTDVIIEETSYQPFSDFNIIRSKDI